MDFKKIIFDFHIKKISAFDIEEDVLKEIQKFSYSLQKLLIKEASIIMDRLKKEKCAPELTSLNCYIYFAIDIYYHVNIFFMNLCIII